MRFRALCLPEPGLKILLRADASGGVNGRVLELERTALDMASPLERDLDGDCLESPVSFVPDKESAVLPVQNLMMEREGGSIARFVPQSSRQLSLEDDPRTGSQSARNQCTLIPYVCVCVLLA